MNDTLQQEIATLIKSAHSAGQNAVDFIGQQAPDVMNQFLQWEYYSNLSSGIICLIIFLSGAFGIYKLYKAINKTKGGEDGAFGVMFFLCAMCFAAFLFSVNQFYDAAKVKIAPKIVLIDYIKTLK